VVAQPKRTSMRRPLAQPRLLRAAWPRGSPPRRPKPRAAASRARRSSPRRH
jgi:hypothetical protein